jgi:hypothetical protein
MIKLLYTLAWKRDLNLTNAFVAKFSALPDCEANRTTTLGRFDQREENK